MTANDFTLGSVRLYAKLFPYCKRVVSTWVDTPTSVVAALQDAGADVLLNSPPSVPGVQNLNYQLISTRAGITLAAESGAEFVLKTRTDQRLHAAGLDVALPVILETFPRTGLGAGTRLLVSSSDTRLFIPFHLSDQLQFGRTADMLTYWTAPMDIRQKSIDYKLPIRHLVNSISIPEVYLARAYLERLGYASDGALESWWSALANEFCVLDASTFDCYWPKYYSMFEHRNRSYKSPSTGEVVTHLNWLRMVRGDRPRLSDLNAVLDRGIADDLSDLLESTPDRERTDFLRVSPHARVRP